MKRTRSNSFRALPILCASALIALVGCKSSDSSDDKASEAPKPVEISEEMSAVATVTAIDRPTRMVTLRREDGDLFQLKVGEAARNFDQIAVGDKLRVRYKATMGASLRPAGETAKEADAAIATARTEAGAKPGGGVGMAASVRVKVESMDLSRDIVVLSLASGELISHRLATPEGRAFAKGLKVGDIVQLDYAEALAISVDEL